MTTPEIKVHGSVDGGAVCRSDAQPGTSVDGGAVCRSDAQPGTSVDGGAVCRYPRVDRPFPYKAVLSVTFALFTNNYAITSCFPYLGQYVVDLGAADSTDKAGYAAGLLAASFMIGRAATSLVWGCAADRYGRRPVLMVCCFAMCTFQLLFGFARSFPVAFAARLFLGMFNGLVGTSKTSIAEVVSRDDARLQSKAMGILGSAVSFGQLIGPSVGGWLADPSSQFPSTALDTAFLRTYRYLLPNIIGALAAFVSGVCIFFWLPETARQDAAAAAVQFEYQNRADSEADDIVLLEMSSASGEIVATINNLNDDPEHDGEQDAPTRIPPWWRSRRVLLPCLLYAFHSMNSMWLNESFPLWCLGSVLVGGLGMSLYEIGMMVSAASLFLIVFQIVAFHRLVDRYGPSVVFSGAALSMAVPTLFLPFASYGFVVVQAANNVTGGGNMTGSDDSDILVTSASRVGTLAAVAFLFGLASSASVSAFASVFMLINNSVTTDQRGAVNGLAMTIASGTKAVGPILGSSLLAWTFEKGRNVSWFFGHTFGFFIVALLWVSLYVVSRCSLPRMHLDVRVGAV